MWKVGSILIWKTECFQHQQRSDWLAAMPGEAQLFAPRPVQKSTHSIPFETGQDHHDGSPLKHFGSPFAPSATIGKTEVNRIEFCGRVAE